MVDAIASHLDSSCRHPLSEAESAQRTAKQTQLESASASTGKHRYGFVLLGTYFLHGSRLPTPNAMTTPYRILETRDSRLATAPVGCGDSESGPSAAKEGKPRHDRTHVREAPRVLIVASVNWEGLSRTPCIFSRAGWIVDIFTSPTFALAQSSFVSKIHAAGESPPELVEQLKAFLALHGTDYRKVILADDPLIWEVARRREEPWARALLPCADDDKTIDFLIFKTDFILGCERHHLPIPRSFVCDTPEQVKHAVRMVGFPLVSKRNQGHSGEGVKVIRSERELDGMELRSSVVIQELIDGRVCSASALYRDGVLLGFYSYFRFRTWGQFGSSTAIKFKAFPQLAGILERLGRISRFDGLCGIDFMHDESTSTIYLLEQNFRPTLTMLLGPRVGVDFVPLLRDWDHPRAHPLLQNAAVQTVVPLFPSDIARAISQRDLPVLLRWLIDPRWIREAGWYDRKLLAHNARFIVRTIRDKVRNAFRRMG